MFIGIAGIIGAGKTTLTNQLADTYGYRAYHEPVEENDYLTDFYEDPERWAAMMQMHLLAKRFEQHQQIVWTATNEGAVQDRTIYEDTIFARLLNEQGKISDRDFNTYISHFNVMKRYLVYPDVIVYLDVDPETALDRIQNRGRGSEQEVSLDYLKRLYDGYMEFVEEIERWTTVLELDWNCYKPVEEVHYMINNAVEGDLKYMRSLRRI